MAQHAIPVPAILRPRTAAPYIGCGRTKLHELHEKDPTFPRKIRFSARCVGWRKEDLDAWLALKAAQAEGRNKIESPEKAA